jgi:hypothetical protein
MKPVAYKYQDTTGWTSEIKYTVSTVHPVDSDVTVTPLYAIPKGYKLVPIEGHWDMTKAFYEKLQEKDIMELTVGDIGEALQLAIEAAPNIEDI